MGIVGTSTQVDATNKAQHQEKSFEDLAMLASSIEMIEVHDIKGNPVATASGIMIGQKGFVVTNCHVLRVGKIYAVRMEDDDEVYVTDEIIKYNTQLDLAVIRIRKELRLLPLYDGRKSLRVIRKSLQSEVHWDCLIQYLTVLFSDSEISGM